MLFSYNWLKEYIDDIPLPLVLAERLTMAGIEVERITDTSNGVKGVITAVVLRVGDHPNADRLKLCEVSTGSDTFNIVCGAGNMKPGDKVALALCGAELPGGVRIKKSKIRGVESEGMLCSEPELGLKETSKGIMILPEDTVINIDFNEALGMNDFILDINITPNRPDLLSIKGLAREVSALYGSLLKVRETRVEESGQAVDGIINIAIESPDACGRYTARAVLGASIGPSPDFIRRRLESMGIRPVNNAVDITNYVMLELGAPLHAFDLDKIQGRIIRIRMTKEGEDIETIDKKERRLPRGIPVIADSSGPVAIAGVMGGERTGITDFTESILIESAWFPPAIVRKACRALELSTDSSYRFERGVDIEAVSDALDGAASLIAWLSGGTVAKGAINIYPQKRVQGPIRFSPKKAERLLGVPLDTVSAAAIFKRLGMTVDDAKDDDIRVSAPSYRFDINEEADLVEEAARLTGYGSIPETLPQAGFQLPSRPHLSVIRKRAAEALVGLGFLEVINYSFVSKVSFSLSGKDVSGGITILNPITEDQTVLRNALVPSLLGNLRLNLSRKNANIKIFEIAPVFLPSGAKLPQERWMIAGLMHGLKWGETWNTPKEWFDFYDVKGAVESLAGCLAIRPEEFDVRPVPTGTPLMHPGHSAEFVLSNRVSGYFGELHPDVCAGHELRRPAYVFELDLEALAGHSLTQRRYTGMARFPESMRDIAFIIGKDVEFRQIINAIRELDMKLIEKVEVFDVYYGPSVPVGRLSMAIRVTYRSVAGTLRQEQVDELHSKVGSLITSRFGAVIRGEASVSG
ncbi:MAG: phenylalanine--tRNA ligase subunit beta [Deltaproteobacteria bacterium]|nr:phenylalanine--tRNA ligase subunit beta [Deltaproteobacteria bacterium]